MENSSRRPEQPNGGNRQIPENILLFSQGFQPQLQNGLPQNQQEGHYFPQEQVPFHGNPGNFAYPAGFQPGQFVMQNPLDVLTSMGFFPQQSMFAGGFPMNQVSPLMIQSMLAPSMLQQIPSNFLQWVAQNPWLNPLRFANCFGQEMNFPWAPRMAPNQFGSRSYFPEVVTLDDNVVPKTEFGDILPSVQDPLKKKQMCARHQKKFAESNDVSRATPEKESVVEPAEAPATDLQVATIELPKTILKKPAVEIENPESPQNIVLIRSATTSSWKIKTGKAMGIPGTPTPALKNRKADDREVNKIVPGTNANFTPAFVPPPKKRRVSFWEQGPTPAKNVPVSKKMAADLDFASGMKVSKEMALGIVKASKTFADGTLSGGVCVLLEDIMPKDDGCDALSDSSDDSSKYCPSLCSCRCLNEESG